MNQLSAFREVLYVFFLHFCSGVAFGSEYPTLLSWAILVIFTLPT